MAKKRVYSHEERTSKKWKLFPFLFSLLSHSFLMIVYIWLKILKFLGKQLPSKNMRPTETYQLTCMTNWLALQVNRLVSIWGEPSMWGASKKTYYRPIISQINPMLATYFLHSLHGQLCGFQVLIAFLKAVKDSFCFISRGTRS